MKTKKKIFKAMALVLALCLGISSIACAAPVKEEASPYTMYFCACSSNFTKLSGKVNLIVTTEASRSVSSIYHDVKIYKNDVLYLSQRYSDTNEVELITSIDIPATTGDYFYVFVDHYTNHNGYLESDDTTAAINY